MNYPSRLSLAFLVLTVSVNQAQVLSSAHSYIARGKQRLTKGDLNGALGDFDAAVAKFDLDQKRTWAVRQPNKSWSER